LSKNFGVLKFYKKYFFFEKKITPKKIVFFLHTHFFFTKKIFFFLNQSFLYVFLETKVFYKRQNKKHIL